MTDEEKKAALEAEEKAKADAKAKAEAKDAEFEDSIADLSEEDQEAKRVEREKAKNLDKGTDYKKEYEIEKAKREKAEKIKAEKRFKKSKQKREDDDDDDDDDLDNDKPLTRAEFRAEQEINRQETEKIINNKEIDLLAEKVCGSEDEKNLVLEIHKGRTFPEGMSLQEQVDEAYVLANRKKLVGERDEALRALKSKKNVSKDGGGSHHDAQPGNETKIDAGIKSELTRQGFTFNSTSRRYEKKLPNGTILFRDTTTGKISKL